MHSHIKPDWNWRPADRSEKTVCKYVGEFIIAERKAYQANGKYVSLDDLTRYGIEQESLDILRNGKAWLTTNPDYYYGDTADKPRAELLLPYDAKAYVLVVYQHQEPFFNSLEDGGWGFSFDAIVVMSPGMWEIARDLPGKFPKIKDLDSIALIEKSPSYKRYLSVMNQLMKELEQMTKEGDSS